MSTETPEIPTHKSHQPGMEACSPTQKKKKLSQNLNFLTSNFSENYSKLRKLFENQLKF